MTQEAQTVMTAKDFAKILDHDLEESGFEFLEYSDLWEERIKNRDAAIAHQAREATIKECVEILETKVVNINGVTNGKSGALIDDPMNHLGGRDAVRGTYIDAILSLGTSK